MQLKYFTITYSNGLAPAGKRIERLHQRTISAVDFRAALKKTLDLAKDEHFHFHALCLAVDPAQLAQAA